MPCDPELQRSVVVVLHAGDAASLRRLLPALRLPADMVVVLNLEGTDGAETVCEAAGVEIVQLGQEHSYARACNVGAEIAKARGCDFLLIVRSDSTPTTNVVRELLAELAADPGLGILAPTQVAPDRTGRKELAYRAKWDLENLVFGPDLERPHGTPHRLESDYCTLAFAAIRLSAIKEVGFLDEAEEFAQADADFGFRLRQAGYVCAYLPNSQIELPAVRSSRLEQGSTARSRRLFAEKHLDRFVSHTDHRSRETDSWSIINRNLHPRLRRDGLVQAGAPELVFSHPGVPPFDILYTVWETSRLPAEWLRFKNSYKVTLTTSRWGKEVLDNAGFARAHYAPLGIDTDLFHPWGSRDRLSDGRTFLWFSRNQYRKGLDVMLAGWRPFHAERPASRLILLGTGITEALPEPPHRRMWKDFRIADYPSEGISVYEVASPLDEEQLAKIYRSVDFTVCSSRAEGFGFSVAESLASGTPAIFGNFSSMADFVTPASLLIDGEPVSADYSDKGFGDVGYWWEPSVPQLTARLFEADEMAPQDYRRLSDEGVRLVRSRFTWRNTSFSIREALTLENEGTVSGPALSARFSRRDADGQARAPAAQAARGPDASPPSRSTRLLGRMLLRGGKLMSHFGMALETDGWSSGIASARGLAIPYARRRLRHAGQIISRAGDRLARFRARSLPTRNGVLFIGYAEGSLGLGQAFRANLRAAAAADLPFSVYPFRKNIETRLIGPFMPERYDTGTTHAINVIEVAADQLPEVYAELPPALVGGSYNILCTYWELPRAPEAWRPHLANVDEIWAPNAFIADAFAPIFDGPITILPPAMESTDGDHPARNHYGMEDGRLYFLFTFDYYSSPFRKNPMGVLKAFRRAFPLGTEPVGLVIKSVGSPDHHPSIRAEIHRAMREDPRILLFDRTMERDEMLGLIRAADVYVSLHRAEGFGLGMAEAMTFGNIVVGTDYSGCTDFLTRVTGYPVPFRLRPVEEHEYPWSAGQVWAEPDEAAAVEILREIADDPSEGRRRGAAARDLVRNRYSPAAVGDLMRERVDALLAERGSPASSAK